MSKGSRDADMLYDYLVSGFSQSKIADDYGMSQPDVSDLFCKRYGLNKGNTKWGKGKNNYSGKFPDLTYDELCDFVNSGSYDFDNWYNGGDDYYDDDYDEEEYYEEEDDTEDNTYETPVNNSYSPVSNSSVTSNSGNSHSYSNNNNSQSNRGQRKVTYVNTNNSNDAWGNIIALGFLALICFVLWLVEGFSSNNVGIWDSLKFIYYSGYLWPSFSLGVIYGIVRFIMSKDLKDVFTCTGLYAWTGVGFVASAIKCYFDTQVFMPSIVLGVIGLIIGFVGYKLFYVEE